MKTQLRRMIWGENLSNYFRKHPCPYGETYRQPTPLVLDHLNSVSNSLAEDIPWKNPGSWSGILVVILICLAPMK